MSWFDIPETTEKEKALKEIAECNYCIHGVIDLMRNAGVPEDKWERNVMVQTYLDRIKKEKDYLMLEGVEV